MRQRSKEYARGDLLLNRSLGLEHGTQLHSAVMTRLDGGSVGLRENY
jgi:hypothetical protein